MGNVALASSIAEAYFIYIYEIVHFGRKPNDRALSMFPRKVWAFLHEHHRQPVARLVNHHGCPKGTWRILRNLGKHGGIHFSHTCVRSVVGGNGIIRRW